MQKKQLLILWVVGLAIVLILRTVDLPEHPIYQSSGGLRIIKGYEKYIPLDRAISSVLIIGGLLFYTVTDKLRKLKK